MEALTSLLLAGVLLVAVPREDGEISGLVFNGTRDGALVADVPITLRVSEKRSSRIVAETTSDQRGRFRFQRLRIDPQLSYVPIAKIDGIEYPGPRIRLNATMPAPNVQLVVFETITRPSPLIVNQHHISVIMKEKSLVVTESLVIANPTEATYVGEKIGDRRPVTLQLALPAGSQQVTFHDEFHGRNFFLLNRQLMTNLAWPPGRRQFTFTYQIPVKYQQHVFQREFELPCDRLTVHVTSAPDLPVICNLPPADVLQGQSPHQFAARQVPAGFRLQLQLGKSAQAAMVYVRWIGGALLLALGIVAVINPKMRRPKRRWREASPAIIRRAA